MKKKKWFNSKTFFTITLVIVVCCFMFTGLFGAKKIEFHSSNAKSFIRQLNGNQNPDRVSIGKTLGLTQDEEFVLLRKRTDFNGVTHYRYQLAYKGIPVWGMHTVVSKDRDNRVVRLNGALVLDTARDIRNIPPASSLNVRGAVERMKTMHREKNIGADWFFKNERSGTYIYVDKNSKAHLCYVFSFFADAECGDPSRILYFIEVNTGKVLRSFDILKSAVGTGPGGNLKIGYYEYGIDYPGFGVTENSGICTMVTSDVSTYDYEHTAKADAPYSYTCYRNTHEEINGGYCPLNDAQYYGQAVFDMYRNWYGTPVTPFPITLGCHYKVNYERTLYDNLVLVFGDGDETFYPMVALDLIAHELSHGFTDFNSDLIYSGQSGGINESFSDMAGEAAKYFVRGYNNFKFCWEIYKDPDGALRYLYDPPLDGNSIDHFRDYFDGMDVHHSSGIFNKAFHLIATAPGWNTRMAFDIFAKANRDYWTPFTTFLQGAEGALSAAQDYGYNSDDVIAAFDAVGVFSSPTTPEMYVYDITQTVLKTGSNYMSKAVVSIRDIYDNPVPDANVSITWSGVVGGSALGTTLTNGTVSFNSAKVESTGPFTITVTDVTHASKDYNPALNIETSDTAYF